MTREHIESIATVLKDTRPSPIHAVEAYEMWEEIVDEFLEMFLEIDLGFDMNRFEDAVGLTN